MNTPTLNQWQEDLIWCPSQCYYYFTADNKKWCIYLRWRHNDPWTAELCECDDQWEIFEEGRYKENLILSHDYSSDDFKFLEMECLKIAKTRFPDSNIIIQDTYNMTDSDLIYQFEHAFDMQERTCLMIHWSNTIKILEQDFGNLSNQLMEHWVTELQKMAENDRWSNIQPSAITSLSNKYKVSTKQVNISLNIKEVEISICLQRGYEAHPYELQFSIYTHDKNLKSFLDKDCWEKQEAFYSLLQSKLPFLNEEWRSLTYVPKHNEDILDLMTSVLDKVNDTVTSLNKKKLFRTVTSHFYNQTTVTTIKPNNDDNKRKIP